MQKEVPEFDCTIRLDPCFLIHLIFVHLYQTIQQTFHNRHPNQQYYKEQQGTTMDKNEHKESGECQMMKLAKEEDERLKVHNKNEWQ